MQDEEDTGSQSGSEADGSEGGASDLGSTCNLASTVDEASLIPVMKSILCALTTHSPNLLTGSKSPFRHRNFRVWAKGTEVHPKGDICRPCSMLWDAADWGADYDSPSAFSAEAKVDASLQRVWNGSLKKLHTAHNAGNVHATSTCASARMTRSVASARVLQRRALPCWA